MSRKSPKPYKNKQHPYLLYKTYIPAKQKTEQTTYIMNKLRLPIFLIKKGDKSIAGVAAAPIIVVRVPFKTPCCSVVRPKVSLIP